MGDAFFTKHIGEFVGDELPGIISKAHFRSLLEEKIGSVSSKKQATQARSCKFFDAMYNRSKTPPKEFGNTPAAWKHETGITNIATSKYEIDHTSGNIYWRADKGVKVPLHGAEYYYSILTDAHSQIGHKSRDALYKHVSKVSASIKKDLCAMFGKVCCKEATEWGKYEPAKMSERAILLNSQQVHSVNNLSPERIKEGIQPGLLSPPDSSDESFAFKRKREGRDGHRNEEQEQHQQECKKIKISSIGVVCGSSLPSPKMLSRLNLSTLNASQQVIFQQATPNSTPDPEQQLGCFSAEANGVFGDIDEEFSQTNTQYPFGTLTQGWEEGASFEEERSCNFDWSQQAIHEASRSIVKSLSPSNFVPDARHSPHASNQKPSN